MLRYWFLGPYTEFSINLLRPSFEDSLDLLRNPSSIVGRYGYPRGELQAVSRVLRKDPFLRKRLPLLPPHLTRAPDFYDLMTVNVANFKGIHKTETLLPKK